VLPIGLRGHALEIVVEGLPSVAAEQALLEGFELIVSRKGEKVSRG